MSRARSFDWEEAARLYAEGATFGELADRYGVTPQGAQYAVDPERRARVATYTARWRRDSACPLCGAQTTRAYADQRRLCWDCANAQKAWTVAPDGRLRCSRCTEWKWPSEFRLCGSVSRARGGHHSHCRPCERLIDAARKRRSRAAARQAAS